MNNFLGIIPARYASTRFPGKPLADIGGKPMIQRVYERAKLVLEDVVVATDDKQIYHAVKAFGGNVVMTDEGHQSGTDRCYEAYLIFAQKCQQGFDVVINIQGDEPFIRPDQIELLKGCFDEETIDIATLIKPIDEGTVIFDPNRPKVVVNKNKEALYFSRSPIPYIREEANEDWIKKHQFYQHIGMYAYRSKVLQKITSMEVGILEKAESLEQMRWLENGLTIKTAITQYESYGIDTPEDLERAIKLGLIKD